VSVATVWNAHTLLAHPQLFSRSHGAYPYIRTAILASSEAQHICRPFAERRGSGTLKSMSVWSHLTFAFLKFFEVRNAQMTPKQPRKYTARMIYRPAIFDGGAYC
jgi:hypothetical protein